MTLVYLLIVLAVLFWVFDDMNRRH